MQRKMGSNDKDILLHLLRKYKELGISDQIDYDKFYLYSIITHSTAIEGSTVTEVEAQLLFDEGLTSSKRTLAEQMMNIDLKTAYEYGREWIQKHSPITIDWLVLLASKVMAHTGSEYNAIGGGFSAAKGELRLLNVTAGLGGKSYMSYQKIPAKLQSFCEELNRRRAAIDPMDICAIYELSYWAHYELVTIHPWADGNGRTSRLLMNLLQMEYGVLPTKVLKQDKATYIQALIDTREQEDISIFIHCMHHLHCEHLQHDIASYEKDMVEGGQKSGQKIVKGGQKTKELILSYLADHPTASRKELSEQIGIAQSAIQRHLKTLQVQGLLFRIGPDKGGHWEVRNVDVNAN